MPRYSPCRLLPAAAVLWFVLSAPAAAAAPSRWINDGSREEPRLSVEQSIWAMGKLPRGGGREWSREEKVAKIAAAGFDGFMVFLPGAPAEQDAYRELAAEHGLAITLHCAPATVEDLEKALAAVKRMGARGLVAMVRPTFVTYEEGAQKIQAMQAASAAAGVPFYIETHRGTITQDLLLAGRWAESIPGVQFHADLSHFVISYGIGKRPDGRIERVFDAVLARTGMVDGRVGNGNQVQIDIGANGDNRHARLFARWWKQGMTNWLKSAGPGDVFIFKSELGPPSYSILDLDGNEISDRWAQAIVMRDLGVRTWNEAVKEAGRGQPYEVGARRAAAANPAGAPSSGLTKANALKVETSGIFARRGDCLKIGDFYLSGQLGPATYSVAAEKGIKTIINVRMERELAALGYEADIIVNEEGMAYHHIPVGPSNIADGRAEKFLKTLREAEKPVLIQGSNGNRVWGLWALYVGVEFGIPVDVTKRTALEHGIKRLVIEDFVREYLANKGK